MLCAEHLGKLPEVRPALPSVLLPWVKNGFCVSRKPPETTELLEPGGKPAWLIDPFRCRILWANKLGLAFWGEETILDLIERKFEPNDPSMQRFSEILSEMNAGEQHRISLNFEPRTGMISISGTCALRPLPDGRPGILFTAQTSDPPAELQDDIRARLLNRAVDVLPHALAVLDGSGELVFYNAACREFISYKADLGTSVLGNWLNDEMLAQDLIERALGLGFISQIIIIHTMFGPRTHRVTVQRISAPIHGYVALVVMCEDVDDRRRLFQSEQNAQGKFKAISTAAVSIVMAFDCQWILTSLNDGALENLGATESDLVGRSLGHVCECLGFNVGEEALVKLWSGGGLSNQLVTLEHSPISAKALLNSVKLENQSALPTATLIILTLILEDPASLVEATDDGKNLFSSEVENTLSAELVGVKAEPNLSDDDATFSEIARAIASHADERQDVKLISDDILSVGEDENETSASAPLRIVGGVDHSKERDATVAGSSLTQSALELLDRPSLVHRTFTIIGTNSRFFKFLKEMGVHKSQDSLNLLNLFANDRPTLFSLQNRFDDGVVSPPGMMETVELSVSREAGGHAGIVATVEKVMFDNQPAMLMRFDRAEHSGDRISGKKHSPHRPASAMMVESVAAAALSEDTCDRAEEAENISEYENELQAILNSAADGIATLDGNGCVITFNPSAEAIFVRQDMDVVGKRLGALLDHDSAQTVDAYLQSVSERAVPVLYREGREVTAVRPDGTTVPLFLTIRLMKVGGGPRFCAVIRDITQWKKSESELLCAKAQVEQKSNEKSDFLARISHELRTPLNAIIGFSEVMSEEKFGPISNNRYKGYLTDIRTSGKHLLSLVNDLLDLSKIDAGKLELNFGSVDLAGMIQQCAQVMQPQANQERIIMRVSSPENLPAIVADERALRQVMINLLSNAIKFTSSGGQVIISSILDEGGSLQIRIRDTGCGMSAEEIVRALEPFSQVGQADVQSSVLGTGLGLPLTKALIEANRAEMRIESTPGAGTLVQIIFPPERVLAS